MAWIYLIFAGISEIGWPLGLKLSQTTKNVGSGIALAVVSMAVSGTLLWLAQKEIPIGTAYAIWTGIGAAGTFVIGILIFGDAQSLGKWLSVALIIGGVVGLKMAH